MYFHHPFWGTILLGNGDVTHPNWFRWLDWRLGMDEFQVPAVHLGEVFEQVPNGTPDFNHSEDLCFSVP